MSAENGSALIVEELDNRSRKSGSLHIKAISKSMPGNLDTFQHKKIGEMRKLGEPSFGEYESLAVRSAAFASERSGQSHNRSIKSSKSRMLRKISTRGNMEELFESNVLTFQEKEMV